MDNNTNQPLVGIMCAYDTANNKVYAEDAVPHAAYTCCYCGCRLCHKVSPKGTHFFARLKGETHSEDICRQIEKKGYTPSFRGSASPEDLFDAMFHVPVSRGGHTPPPGGGEPHKPHPPKPGSGDVDPSFRPFSNLKQMHEVCLIDKNPYEDCGNGHTISDYYIHFKWYRKLASADNFSLGARALQVAPVLCSDYRRNFLFEIYDGTDFKIRFVLHAATSSIFKDIYDKLFIKEHDDVTDKLRNKRKVTQAVIASAHWTKAGSAQCKASLCSPRDESYCANCQGLYYAELTSAKQVYPIQVGG